MIWRESSGANSGEGLILLPPEGTKIRGQMPFLGTKCAPSLINLPNYVFFVMYEVPRQGQKKTQKKEKNENKTKRKQPIL